ncbi:hypothetical protein [Sulfurimonas paralvinellae]|uniref:Copper resistance protein D domain-containing protein n=1 Tax=Sulfurimonas paralvinellae TaxID=317658 RepID=A0A7M1B4Z9_9BACT|nr:hypothetical protein [Sulfurimonas paralvinellae]QOP44803.1 hypothetical protein FM071_00195 [Sulfurimonas paralvinellae]
MSYLIHFHLLAAIAWIGGSIFMFVLGITLTDKEKQREVYPHVGPIFGYFELVSLSILLVSGIIMIDTDGLLDLLLSDETNKVAELLKMKLWLVLSLVVATVIHFFIAYRTNNKERTNLQNFISRGSSLFIFFVNLFVLHYAIMIRSILA